MKKGDSCPVMSPSMFATTRRHFFKISACAIASVPLLGSLRSEAGTDLSATLSGSTAPSSTGSGSKQNYLHRDTRLSIAMWDFSWLLAQYPGGAYEDLERRVAEAAERGYNTLRVDCFPSRILEPESTFPALGSREEPAKVGSSCKGLHVQRSQRGCPPCGTLPKTRHLAGLGLMG